MNPPPDIDPLLLAARPAGRKRPVMVVDRRTQPPAEQDANAAAAAVLPGLAGPARAELWRLMAMLLMLIDGQRSVVVHVAATAAGEGASSVAREVAAAVAATGWCKVALLDADTVPGGDTGLLADVARGTPVALRPGRLGGAPVSFGAFGFRGDPLGSIDAVRSLYAQLRSGFTLVVVDCPPILPGQGAAMLGSAADGTVVVVEAERTRTPDALRARRMLAEVGAPMLGVVFNKRRTSLPAWIDRFL